MDNGEANPSFGGTISLHELVNPGQIDQKNEQSVDEVPAPAEEDTATAT